MQHLELCISSLQTIRLKFIEVLNIHQYLKFLITFFLSWYQVMGKLLNRTKASCIIQFCFSKCAPKFERASKREFCHFVNEKCKKLQKTVSMSVKGWKGKRERMCSIVFVRNLDRGGSSVTRCWSKKCPNCLQKLPQKFPHQFNVKSYIFHNSPKLLLNIWATFARNFVPENFQKSPNLVTLELRRKPASALSFEAKL